MRAPAWEGVRVAFRADASREIGHGHVMRCLTLADALVEQGAACLFVCRPHEGNLVEGIRARGHAAGVLPASTGNGWLGATPKDDAAQTLDVLRDWRPHWLVVDHYAIDAQWESALSSAADKLLVIDDLANRPHACDLLLDQTLGRKPLDYAECVPPGTVVLAGAQFALLRPEFAAFREASLARRRRTIDIERILISLGGVDADNAAGAALDALVSMALPASLHVTVIAGRGAPHLKALRQQCANAPFLAQVVVDANDMAPRLTDTDLAIGAAGSSAWERCCLGVPTLLVVAADNQRTIAAALVERGAAHAIGTPANVRERLPDALQALAASPGMLATMSEAASGVTDGLGVSRVIEAMERLRA